MSQPHPASGHVGKSSRLRNLLRMLRGRGSRKRKAVSVGLGLFIGCLPLYGLHFPLCVAVCVPFGLDTLLAYLAANISNPLLLPLILLAEVEIGSWVIHGHSAEFSLEAARRLGALGFGSEVAVGSVLLGAALGLVGGLLTARFSAKTEPSALELARERTLARYAQASPADRHYVRMKLSLDPVVEQIGAMTGLGRVLDAGCGRGQLGLLLLETGSASHLVGFDFDARKVQVAERAAHGQAQFSVANLIEAPLDGHDSVLLIDVLHYLSRPEQNALLERAARALPPGGRLLIRETDKRRSLSSAITRGLEYLATRVGYNRAQRRLEFRSLAELSAELEQLGLSCTLSSAADPALSSSPLSNGLLVAQRDPKPVVGSLA